MTMLRGSFAELTVLTLVGVLCIISKVLSLPGDAVFALAKLLLKAVEAE